MRPRLLDLFCGAGGAAMGYARAGFDVTGVDNRPQPRYPFEFRQADAMTYDLAGYDAIHASPPCQDHSTLRSIAGDHGTAWMLEATMRRLDASGLPWVVENVGAAEFGRWPVMTLCGTQFDLTAVCRDGIRRELRRHRRFASSALLMAPGHCWHRLGAVGVYGNGGGGQMTRGYKATADVARAVLEVDWMTTAELCQAIPPAYTQHIGEQLAAHIGATA